MLEWSGKKIGIFGFNGVWACGPDEARGNLWLGSRWQLNLAKKELAAADLRIGLIHHPPDWYTDIERKELKRLDQTFHLLLHGHEHDAWLHPNPPSHLRIAAGASYAESKAEFGYNLGELDLDTGEGKVHLRTYNGRAWVLHPVEVKAPNGIWSFQLDLKTRA